MSVPDDWVAQAAAALDLDPAGLDVPGVLVLARDVAHAVARPAAPVTAFLVGLAAGRDGGDPQAVRRATDKVFALLEGQRWRDHGFCALPEAEVPGSLEGPSPK